MARFATNRMVRGGIAAVLCTVMLALCATAQTEPALKLDSKESRPVEASATAIIFNEQENESAGLAAYYAAKRNIPRENMIGLRCSGSEVITRAEYESTIAEPLRGVLRSRGWWKLGVGEGGTPTIQGNKIRFVALIRGVPLKIAPVPDFTPDVTAGRPEMLAKNEASVDSELAVLAPVPGKISGAALNPYFHSYSRIMDVSMPQIMLVCRLDGPSATTVKRMIDDSLKAEQEGLWGICYVDIRGLHNNPYQVGDDALKKAAVDAQHEGIPVIMDAGENLFPTGYPMRKASLYYGWYAEQPGGPFAGIDRIFNPGGIGFHLHSFSADTVRSPNRFWVGPILEHGAAAAIGSVYEPFLSMLVNVDLFQERIRRGYTFAEACYIGQPGLSWMNTCVGDPLYRPFRAMNDLVTPPAPSEWTAYREGARIWFEEGHEKGEAALREAGNTLHSGMIFESLALLLAAAKDLDNSFGCLERARRYYSEDADVVRCYLHEVNLRRFNGDRQGSLTLVRQAIRKHPKPPAVDLLRTIELEINPPPSPSASPKP